MADQLFFYTRPMRKSDVQAMVDLHKSYRDSSTLIGQDWKGLPTAASFELMLEIAQTPGANTICLVATPSTDQIDKASHDNKQDLFSATSHQIDQSIRDADQKAGKGAQLPPILGFMTLSAHNPQLAIYDKTADMSFGPCIDLSHQMQLLVHEVLALETMSHSLALGYPFEHFLGRFCYSENNPESQRLFDGYKAGGFEVVGRLQYIAEINCEKFDVVFVQRSIQLHT